MTPIIPPDRGAQAIPVYRIDERRAHDAFAAHKALLECERMRPALRHNPAWTVLRQDAFENFFLAFEALQ